MSEGEPFLHDTSTSCEEIEFKTYATFDDRKFPPVEYKAGELPAGPPVEMKLPEGLREEELRAAGFSLLRSFDIHEHHDFELWVPSISF